MRGKKLTDEDLDKAERMLADTTEKTSLRAVARRLGVTHRGLSERLRARKNKVDNLDPTDRAIIASVASSAIPGGHARLAKLYGLSVVDIVQVSTASGTLVESIHHAP